MSYKYLYSLVLLLAIAGNAFAQNPRVEKLAEWYQQGYYIINPVLSSTTDELAFVRRFSSSDSLDTANLPEDNAISYLSKEAVRARPYDPVVCLFNTNNRQLSILDFGWAPVFSPRANRIAYAGQQLPLQKQDKLYANAYKGNNIKVFNQVTHSTEVVASAATNFLLDPFFADSIHLIYKLGAQVNGPYGAGISFNEVNLQSKQIRPISLPTIKSFQYVLAGKAILVNKRLAYTLYSPADSGSSMAGRYHHLLISGKDTLHDFGVQNFTNLNHKFAYNRDNQLVYLDDQHYMAEDTNYLLTYKGHRMPEKKAIHFKYDKSYLSTGGKYLLYITSEEEIYLLNLKNLRKTKIELPARDLHAVAWNEDESKIALVQDHETMAGTDKITIFNIK